MGEILNNALPMNYREELTSKQWNIYEQPFQKTVDRLETVEPAIKKAAVTAKSIANLNMKCNGCSCAKKRNSNGNEKATGDK